MDINNFFPYRTRFIELLLVNLNHNLITFVNNLYLKRSTKLNKKDNREGCFLESLFYTTRAFHKKQHAGMFSEKSLLKHRN